MMSAKLAKLLSLLACAVLAVAAFRLEKALCGLNRWRTGIMEVRACFYAIPALFALWLAAFCRVRAAWWRWAAFAASYALWFVLSYIFYGTLVMFFYSSETLGECALGVYALFVLENVAVKKLSAFRSRNLTGFCFSATPRRSPPSRSPWQPPTP